MGNDFCNFVMSMVFVILFCFFFVDFCCCIWGSIGIFYGIFIMGLLNGGVSVLCSSVFYCFGVYKENF